MDFLDINHRRMEASIITSRKIIEEFPLVKSCFLMNMDTVAYYSEFIHIFPYLIFGKQVYVDIYIYDGTVCRRYIICQNCYMHNEKEFIGYIRNNNAKFHIENVKKFADAVYKNFSKFHIKKIDNNQRYFESLYYSVFDNGIRQTLYQACLINIAYNINNFEINIIGESPQEILAPLSMSCIKFFENGQRINEIFSLHSRKRINKIYKRFHGLLNTCNYSLSHYQWEYLYDILIQENSEIGIFPLQFSMKIFDTLRFITEEQYVDYIYYFSIRKKLQPLLGKIDIPITIEEMEESLLSLEEIWECYKNKNEFNPRIFSWYIKRKDLKEEIGEYRVAISSDLKSYLLKAKKMHNCLLSKRYLELIAQGNVVVLFFTKINDADDMFAVEINYSSGKGPCVCQCYGVGNRHLMIEEITLLKQYTEKKGIKFSIEELLELYEEDPFFEIDDDRIREWYYQKIMSLDNNDEREFF